MNGCLMRGDCCCIVQAWTSRRLSCIPWVKVWQTTVGWSLWWAWSQCILLLLLLLQLSSYNDWNCFRQVGLSVFVVSDRRRTRKPRRSSFLYTLTRWCHLSANADDVVCAFLFFFGLIFPDSHYARTVDHIFGNFHDNSLTTFPVMLLTLQRAPQSKGLLYSNVVIGMLAVHGWAVTFSTSRWVLCGLRPCPVAASLYQM